MIPHYRLGAGTEEACDGGGCDSYRRGDGRCGGDIDNCGVGDGSCGGIMSAAVEVITAAMEV